MCYGRLVFAEMPLEIRQYETDTLRVSTMAGASTPEMKMGIR